MKHALHSRCCCVSRDQQHQEQEGQLHCHRRPCQGLCQGQCQGQCQVHMGHRRRVTGDRRRVIMADMVTMVYMYCTYVCIYTYVIFVFTHKCRYICTYMHMYMCIQRRWSPHLYIYIHICIYIYKNIYILYIYIYL